MLSADQGRAPLNFSLIWHRRDERALTVAPARLTIVASTLRWPRRMDEAYLGATAGAMYQSAYLYRQSKHSPSDSIKPRTPALATITALRISAPSNISPPGHRPVTIVYHVAITFKSRVGAIVRGQLLKGGIRPGAHVLGADVREGATVRWQMSYLHLYCIACCRHVTRHDSALRGAAVDVWHADTRRF